MPPRTVILLGYRGSGKSSVGRRLAQRLGLPFVDTDELVLEAFDGRSVQEIWEKEGEPAFREAEARVVADVVAASAQSDAGGGWMGGVIALGGGAVTQSEAAREAVADCAALRVYLQAPPAVLAARIGNDATSAALRPSLTGDLSAVEEVAQVLALREPVYLDVADVVIDVSDASVEGVVDAILNELGGG